MAYFSKPVFGNQPAKLGEILLYQNELHRGDLTRALDIQRKNEARLGDILIAHRFASQESVKEALNAQIRRERLDISVSRPDPNVVQGLDPRTCIRLRALPWRRVGKTLLIAAADHSLHKQISAEWPGRIRLIHADFGDINRSIEDLFSPHLVYAAAHSCPERHSCRNLDLLPKSMGPAVGIGLALGFVAANPSLTFLLLFLLGLLGNFSTTILRALSLGAYLIPKKKPLESAGLSQITDHFKRPRVSVLIPLFREEKVIPSLLSAMDALTYPKELLDIKILLEEHDDMTRAALERANLPHWAHPIIVPPDTLQTKPRAMNYALPYCTGSIIGIYDAEDRPDPDQIDKVVAHLVAAPPRIVAVQCNLDFYNTEDNWLSRCFTIEYASWFRVIMRGMQRLGLPLPLGGTSVFMRRSALEEIGGWDAHNVTEDADLGMRLARFGYRCEMVDSTTWEEANKVRVGWVKQRSRWIKGFIITWLTHMRRPKALVNELGVAGFLALQVILLGTATAFLLAPIFWFMWLGIFGFEWGFIGDIPEGIRQAIYAGLLFGEAVMVTISVVAIGTKRKFGLLPFILTMPLYWPLGTFAAFKAVYEIVFDPFYWDKTTHGLD